MIKTEFRTAAKQMKVGDEFLVQNQKIVCVSEKSFVFAGNAKIVSVRDFIELSDMVGHLVVYEPPEEKTAFQKWNESKPVHRALGIFDFPERVAGRHEGWNAALDAVSRLDTYSIDLYKPGDDVCMVRCDQVKELKEP